MQEQMTRRVCKKCLLSEFDEETYLTQLKRVIDMMDHDIKADDELFQKRLSVCKECEKLSEGTCIGCGCYVELRAAVKKNRCPYKFW